MKVQELGKIAWTQNTVILTVFSPDDQLKVGFNGLAPR